MNDSKDAKARITRLGSPFECMLVGIFSHHAEDSPA